MIDIAWATSIPPEENAKEQSRRIQSWGGHVSTYHVAEELPGIIENYPQVSMQLLTRSGQATLGKPVPFLADILARQYQAGDQDDQVYGLMNADITLEVNAVQRQWLQDQARTSLVCIRRTDVPNPATPLNAGSQLPQGYDTFLYPRFMIPDLFTDGFCLGAPFWDFWMPVAAMLAGHQVTVVTAPVARHVKHTTQWNAVARTYMDIFICSVHQAILQKKVANPVLSALCGHNVAAYGAWKQLASDSDQAAALLNQVFDDFQVRMCTVVQTHAAQFKAI